MISALKWNGTEYIARYVNVYLNMCVSDLVKIHNKIELCRSRMEVCRVDVQAWDV